MEKYCVSQPLAERLRENGFAQNTLWMWLDHNELGTILVERGTLFFPDNWKSWTAPLSDELLEQLPRYIEINAPLTILITQENPRQWLTGYTDPGTGLICCPTGDPSEKLADALALLWLWLHEENGLLGENK